MTPLLIRNANIVLLQIAVLLSSPSVFGAYTLKSTEGELPFIDRHMSEFSIVIPDVPATLVFPEGESITYVADFLNEYLDKVCGVELPVVRESDIDSICNKLFLGSTRYAREHIGALNELKAEELVIRIAKDNIIICGETSERTCDRGTLFGVYEFCERFLNVRWYYPDDVFYKEGSGIIAPAQDSITLPQLEFSDYPESTQRDHLIGYHHYGTTHEGLLRAWHPVLRFGGSRKYKTANHTQEAWFTLYGKTHPEYFAKTSKGKIKNGNLCYSHDAVLGQMIKNIEAWDTQRTRGLFGARNPDSDCVYFCPADGLTPRRGCYCADCQKHYTFMRSQRGTMSDLIFDYIRRYALAIDRRWPGRRLAVLAYSFYQLPPVHVALPGNVDVTIVFRDNMRSPKQYDDAVKLTSMWLTALNNDPSRLSFWHNLISNNIYSLAPLTVSSEFKRFFKWLKDNGIPNKHYFVGYDPHQKRFEAASIQAYPELFILSRLLWNPDNDIDSMLKDYCERMYGPAANTMYDAFQSLYRCGAGRIKPSDMDEQTFLYNVKYPLREIEKLRALLETAKSHTITHSMPYYRIDSMQKSFRNGFAAEVERYHRARPDEIRRYICYLSNSEIDIDGSLVESVWQSLSSCDLNLFSFGDTATLKSEVRLFRTEDSIHIGASFQRSANRAACSIDKEELRIQVATSARSNSEAYAPNIDKGWKEFTEYRISAKGEVTLYDAKNGKDGVSLQYPCKTKLTSDTLTFEAKLPIDILEPSGTYVQFMRYWGVWNHFYTWTPMFSPNVGNYATRHFGLIVFSDQLKKKHTALE